MRVVSVLVEDIAEVHCIQLGLSAASGCIDREKNGPCDTATDEADKDYHLEKAQEEVGVQRLMVEDVSVW